MSVALGSTWTDIKIEHEKSYKIISKYREEEKSKSKNSRCEASIEIAGSMKSSLKEAIKDLEKKCLYEFNTASKDSILKAILTDRQRQIVQLRQKHSISVISKLLCIDPRRVFESYQEALKKIEKYLRSEDKELSVLSPQQRKIHNMIKSGKTDEEIMKDLGIIRQSLNKQKNRITDKLDLAKTKRQENR